MTIPAGSPAWLRTNDFTTYGGDPNKKNFAARGVVNPRTDVGAEGFSRLASDVAAVMRTAEFCSMRVLVRDTAPIGATVESCRLMTGATAASYDGATPPPGFPTVTRNGNGDVSVTFDEEYVDEYGVTGAFVAQDPIACMITATGGNASPQRVSDTQIRVRCFTLLAVADINSRFTLTIGSGS